MLYKVAFISIVSVLVIAVIIKIVELENKKKEIIKVQISLINKCKLYDKVFMVKAIPSGKVAKFVDKKAIMFLERASKVMLIVNKEFPGFHFCSIPVSVSYNTSLIADCSNSDRLDSIFDSLNKQFNKDSN